MKIFTIYVDRIISYISSDVQSHWIVSFKLTKRHWIQVRASELFQRLAALLRGYFSSDSKLACFVLYVDQTNQHLEKVL